MIKVSGASIVAWISLVVLVLLGRLFSDRVDPLANWIRPTFAAQPVPKTIFHPYFERVIVPQRNATGKAVLLDGKPIPMRFTLRIADENIPEAQPMEFVLVMPQNIEIDGLIFSVDRPFYIATTELSNGQYAALFGGAQASFKNYEAFVAHQYYAARFAWDTPDEALAGIRKHLENPAMPALALGPGEAAARAARLSAITRMDVRLPTIAQWFCAMRAGSGERFWWGDSLPEASVAWRTGSAREEAAFEHLRAVDDGALNPLGLHHMVGNAGELAFPSEREREILRTRFGPRAPDATIERHTEVGFTVRPSSALVLGGSVTTGNTMEEARSWESFVRRTTQWDELLLWNQMEVNPGWCFHINWCTGVRFVIEIPAGKVTYVETE